MRVAGHTYAFRDRPLDEALDAMAGLGLGLVEVWLGHADDGPEVVAAALEERGLQAVAVSAGSFYRRESDAPARAFELALAIGAPAVVACVSPDLVAAVSEQVPPGIVLCVENHWDQPFATPRALSEALAGLPELCVCLDTGHAILAGVSPERFASSLGVRLHHVHLKDGRPPTAVERLLGRRLRRRFLERPAPVFPGAGALRVDRLRGTLERIGYPGAVSVEHEGAEPMAALARLLDEWRLAGEGCRAPLLA